MGGLFPSATTRGCGERVPGCARLVLRNAEIELAVPFAFDILFFGYNKSTDQVTAEGR
jgi:hypothetical protein